MEEQRVRRLRGGARGAPSRPNIFPAPDDPRCIRVAIVDDARAMRHLLRLVLTSELGFEVVGEAETGLGALSLAAQAAPDVIVMDGSMPVMDGIEATRLIREQLPGVAILAHTSDATFEQEMRVAGAAVAVAKGATVDQVIDGVRRAAIQVTQDSNLRLDAGQK